MCGIQSANGRTYPIAVLEAAIPLYEKAACYVNHPASADDMRDVRDHVGRFVNVRLAEDGLYGDLEYLAESPYAKTLIETAERMPEQIGCSHNADGEVEPGPDGLVVTRINEVRSVDIVATPATTNGLFEARKRMKLRDLLEAAAGKETGGKLQTLRKLLEDDGMSDPLAAPVEVASDPDTALSDGFKAGMYSVVDAYVAGDMELGDALNKLKELAKAHDKLVGKAEPAAESEDEEAGDDEEEVKEEGGEYSDKKDEKAMEARLLKLERRDATRDLCESLGFTPTKDQLSDLCEIADDKTRRRIAEAFKAAAKTDNTTKPRSRGVTGINEGRRSASISDAEFLEAITGN